MTIPLCDADQVAEACLFPLFVSNLALMALPGCCKARSNGLLGLPAVAREESRSDFRTWKQKHRPDIVADPSTFSEPPR
jgi:hypothetical protein